MYTLETLKMGHLPWIYMREKLEEGVGFILSLEKDG